MAYIDHEITNFEWLVTKYPDLVADFISSSHSLAICDGVPMVCNSSPYVARCKDCEFDKLGNDVANCAMARKQWLNSPKSLGE